MSYIFATLPILVDMLELLAAYVQNFLQMADVGA